MQRVQTCIRLTAEPTITRTLCRFGIQRRLETLWAWLTRFPNTGALPQTSHIFAIFLTPRLVAAGSWRLAGERRSRSFLRTANYLLPPSASKNAKGVDCNHRPDSAQAE